MIVRIIHGGLWWFSCLNLLPIAYFFAFSCMTNIVLEEGREFSETSALVDEAKNHGESKVDHGQVSYRRDDKKSVKIESSPSVSIFGQCRTVLASCFQPPVIGSVAGIVVVAFPRLRGVFVDMDDRDNSAPLQFLFDGLYAIGQSAVPINMMILGCNLSSSVSLYKSLRVKSVADASLLSMRTMMGVVVGKMIVIPFIGILSAWILKTFVLDTPADIDGAFYLVLMIVFLTPTANNVMVMVELSGSGAKEGMANVIALQYLVAPVVLSCTMTIAIGVASGWTS
jgi:hypothetical protein